MSSVLPFSAGILFGFLLFFLTSHDHHPKSLKKRLPRIKIKNFEFSPNLKITVKSRQIHVHHWLFLIIIFGIAVYYQQQIFESLTAVKGFLLGGAAQGLTYSDRFQILKRLPKT